MWGTIIGDIAGSPYENPHHRPRIKSKDFPLFSAKSRFTDDTVTTVAVAAALLECEQSHQSVTETVAEKLRFWCRRYPHRGYGKAFISWYRSDTAGPYGSGGNGAAMRVAPAGWLGRSLAEAEMLAELTAVVTHNCGEAVCGAKAVSGAIYLARTGNTKAAIRQYVQQYFYPLDKTIDEIRPLYRFSSRMSASAPEAIEAFLDSSGFEDAVRNAVSLGGDTDTQAAIAGSIAEAYYGVPDALIAQTAGFLTDELLQEIRRFIAYRSERG